MTNYFLTHKSSLGHSLAQPGITWERDLKNSKSSRPSPRKDASRAKLTTPARERPKVSVQLEPTIYKNLLDAAEANRISVTAEAERRLEKSFEPRFATYSLESYGAHVMAAFRMGGQMAAPDRPYEEWIKDEAAFDRAVALAVEALLSWRPKPLRDAAGSPIKVHSVHTTVSFNPADAGKLHFITAEPKPESKD